MWTRLKSLFCLCLLSQISTWLRRKIQASFGVLEQLLLSVYFQFSLPTVTLILMPYVIWPFTCFGFGIATLASWMARLVCQLVHNFDWDWFYLNKYYMDYHETLDRNSWPPEDESYKLDRINYWSKYMTNKKSVSQPVHKWRLQFFHANPRWLVRQKA